MLLPIRFIDNYLLRNIICNFLICLSAMAERHILLFSRPNCRAFVFLPAAGIKWSFSCCPAAGTEGSLLFCLRPGLREACFLARDRAVDFSFSCPRPGPWVSAPNLLTKIPALFENIGTRGHQSAFLAHFTYKSLLWRRKTGTGAGVDVI